jgi:hypothetical protein
MPSYDALPEVELDALVAYLQGLRAVGADGRLISAPAAPENSAASAVQD